MPGTVEQYMSDEDTQKAIDIIEQAVSEQKTGAEILNVLNESGLRVYSPEDVGGAPEEEGGPEEMAEPIEDIEPAMEEGPMALEEEEGYPEGEPGLEPKSGEEGGMRDMRIDAVRFALDKDKKNKEQAEEGLV